MVLQERELTSSLSDAYGFVKRHKGFIEVESEIRKGTKFKIFFPIQTLDIKLTKHVLESLKNVFGGNETILFVEDEDYLAESIKTILQDEGYNVLFAKDGIEAVEIYMKNKDRISLILSGLGLPKMDKHELYKKIKDYNPEVRFIITSGYLEPNRKIEKLKAGVKDFMLKPYKLADLLKMIREVIDKN